MGRIGPTFSVSIFTTEKARGMKVGIIGPESSRIRADILNSMQVILIVIGAVAFRLLLYAFQLAQRGRGPRKIVDWMRGEHHRDHHA